ncbi:HNH endonuclease signature motif containing protein [Streptomyces sp. NPDC059161]|uniref:HNH endonuclease signature motif containing protein n=1 Tax=unclassified Streptomyces TaxID=2593676 RepID=UPI00365D2E32
MDHIKPMSQGGRSVAANGQVLCRYDHAEKTGQEAAAGTRKAASRRQRPVKKHPGAL